MVPKGAAAAGLAAAMISTILCYAGKDMTGKTLDTTRLQTKVAGCLIQYLYLPGKARIKG